MKLCENRRQPGQRSWSYQWLIKVGKKYMFRHFRDLPYDPVSIVRSGDQEEISKLENQIERIEGTIVDYKGPQQCRLDLGQKLKIRFYALQIIRDDDQGKKGSVFVSFDYDGIKGWGPKKE